MKVPVTERKWSVYATIKAETIFILLILLTNKDLTSVYKTNYTRVFEFDRCDV